MKDEGERMKNEKKRRPIVYVIAGPNGAGKTTIVRQDSFHVIMSVESETP
jgi:signal recognition particle GTPase